jgi:hypothetical protein
MLLILLGFLDFLKGKSMSKLCPDGSPHPTLQEFAKANGLDYPAALRLARRRKIFGAYQNPRSKHWYVGPPAKIIKE